MPTAHAPGAKPTKSNESVGSGGRLHFGPVLLLELPLELLQVAEGQFLWVRLFAQRQVADVVFDEVAVGKAVTTRRLRRGDDDGGGTGEITRR